MASIGHQPEALRLKTWNLQGAKTDGASLFEFVFDSSDSFEYDVLCLQEIGPAGDPFGTKIADKGGLTVWYRHRTVTYGGWCILHLAFGVNEGGSRCSTAVAIRLDEASFQKCKEAKKVPHYITIDPKYDHKYQDSRRILCVQHPASSLYICCVHAPASERASSYLEYMYGKISGSLPQWIVAGDHNVDPDHAPSGATKWGAIAPTKPTHNARHSNPTSRYDYVTTNQRSKAVDVLTDKTNALSDHHPATFWVQPSS